MKNKTQAAEHFATISTLHKYLNIKGPNHPLVSVIRLDDIVMDYSQIEQSVSYHYNFYLIGFKKNLEGKLRYGQEYYDFDAGVVSCIGPGQSISVAKNSPSKADGYMLLVHADFFASYPLAAKIKEYGFFSYATNEALHLSDEEEALFIGMLKNIESEFSRQVDHYTQDLVVSHIELLLNYCNRFYNRQFITRKNANNELLARLEAVLTKYFEAESLSDLGMPSVQFVAAQLHISPNYLSDMLRASTGRTTNQHIQEKAIERAKVLLASTNLTVAEIAYQLGFEFPQSLNKLFKRKTNSSPLEYRQSLS